MTTIASQITSLTVSFSARRSESWKRHLAGENGLTVVYSTVYSDTDQRKHQSSASLAFVWGIHQDRWIPRTKGQLREKCFHLMASSWIIMLAPREIASSKIISIDIAINHKYCNLTWQYMWGFFFTYDKSNEKEKLNSALFPFDDGASPVASFTNIPDMDEQLHILKSVGWNYLPISKLQRLHRWSLGMDK